MYGTDTTKISKTDDFIEGFQKDHGRLLALLDSFQKAVEASKTDEAKEVLSQINAISEEHFTFEETYLYPRLRRLVSEITENLRQEQQIMREFISKSRSFLSKNKPHQNELSVLWDKFPRLSKLLGNCNELVFLTEKFNKEDKEDLNIRFTECRKTRGNNKQILRGGVSNGRNKGFKHRPENTGF